MISSPLRITVPVKITGPMLHATDVPEADYDVWSAGTTYALGARVIKDHVIWESAQASNLSHDPATAGAAWWLKVSATNRWKLFDFEQVTTTQQATAMYYEIDPGQPVTSVHTLGLDDMDAVRVRVYDNADASLKFDGGLNAAGLLPVDPDWWCYCYGPWSLSNQQHYRDLPYIVNPRIRVDYQGGAGMGTDVLLLGNDTVFGAQHGTGVLAGAKVRFDRPASFQANEFDIPTMRTSALITTVTFTLALRASDVDALVDFYREHGNTVCLFTISEQWRTTQLLGKITSMEPLLQGPTMAQFAFEIRGVPQQ